MVYYSLQIVVKSVEVIKNACILFSAANNKMHVYTTTVSLVGPSGEKPAASEVNTSVLLPYGSEPIWSFWVTLPIDGGGSESHPNNDLMVVFRVKSCGGGRRRDSGGKSVGICTVPVRDLRGQGNSSCQGGIGQAIRSESSGKIRGMLYFDYMFVFVSEDIAVAEAAATGRNASAAGTTAMSGNHHHRRVSPSPSAPPYVENYEDDLFYFSPPTNNDSMGSSSSGMDLLPKPSAPYLPLEIES
ncbi:OLC1v1000398C1 [Oldenlandia corymbosa var. corymbosa]|uniref:OLC1v1000398C1 n=1 Tax=Oldenlandia corymbosa var. corymbosa TaxID=529605 RepID=A0AAV1D593_OLDCO|nr:OLC1v1000398C1 [Oldenlandia corymbosa var. corymbosa]